MQRILAVTIIAGLLTVPLTTAPPAPADDPVVNGDFELFVPDTVAKHLEGTPADECIGIGHQVFYGSETWQQRVEDAATSGADGDTDNATENATRAVDMWTSAPVQEAKFFAGYGHCVFSQEEGYDVVWLNPVEKMQDEAVHWSQADNNTAFGDFDADGDREARIGANASASGHNLWQAWPSPHQAYSGNFDHLTLTVEDGPVPRTGRIVISLSATPLEEVSPWLVLFLDCQLIFGTEHLQPDADGVIQVDPADARFRADNDGYCDEAKEEWDQASDEERHEILGRLRIVQLSFWGFNRGDQDLVFDDVGLKGTTTAAEEAATGNTDHPFSEEPESQDNGVVMMVHGDTDPDPTAGTPFPPGHEALLATNNDSKVRLAVIPYSPYSSGTWRPNDLSGANPQLLVDVPGVNDLLLSPNVDPADHPRCTEETSLHGHEGPLSACLVFEVPAEKFDGRNAPALELYWDDGMEAYNAPAHIIMHSSFEGSPFSVEQADHLTGQPTPFVVESAVDPAG